MTTIDQCPRCGKQATAEIECKVQTVDGWYFQYNHDDPTIDPHYGNFMTAKVYNARVILKIKNDSRYSDPTLSNYRLFKFVQALDYRYDRYDHSWHYTDNIEQYDREIAKIKKRRSALRDYQVSLVYRSEQAFFEQFNFIDNAHNERSEQYLYDMVELIEKSEYWQQHTMQKNRRNNVTLIFNDKRTNVCISNTSLNSIELSNNISWSKTEWLVLHELAHLLTDPYNVPDHGVEFMQAYIALVSLYFGSENGQKFAEYMSACGVEIA